MAVFPSLNPQTRIYTPGQHPASNLLVLTGEETSVRHTNAGVNFFLTVSFVGLTSLEYSQLNNHYILHGRFQPFDLPDSVLRGSGIQVPADYQWIYADKPQVSYRPGVSSVSIRLQLVPPYSL